MLMPPGGAAATVYPTLEALLAAVRACRACEAHLPLGPRPVLRAGATARILVVGQAPGVRVHTTGIPWEDPSGRSEEHTSELQSPCNLVCRLLLEKKKKTNTTTSA